MKRQRAQELRAAVDRLPLGTRQAMLNGIDKKPIIVGADGNLGGGVCPMLAASAGSQKQVGRPFARAWDAYGHARFARRATKRELLALRTMLVASIESHTKQGSPRDLREGALLAQRVATEREVAPALDVDAALAEQPRRERKPERAVDLAAAIADHEATKQRNRAAEVPAEVGDQLERERVDTGERDRTVELSDTHGWAWLRPFRRFEDYERALEELREEAEARLSSTDERELAGRI
jgi:hypothetical protein